MGRSKNIILAILLLITILSPTLAITDNCGILHNLTIDDKQTSINKTIKYTDNIPIVFSSSSNNVTINVTYNDSHYLITDVYNSTDAFDVPFDDIIYTIDVTSYNTTDYCTLQYTFKTQRVDNETTAKLNVFFILLFAGLSFLIYLLASRRLYK